MSYIVTHYTDVSLRGCSQPLVSAPPALNWFFKMLQQKLCCYFLEIAPRPTHQKAYAFFFFSFFTPECIVTIDLRRRNELIWKRLVESGSLPDQNLSGDFLSAVAVFFSVDPVQPGDGESSA